MSMELLLRRCAIAGCLSKVDVWDGSYASVPYSSGSGTLVDPYLVTMCSQLAGLSRYGGVAGAVYKQTVDFDFNGGVFTFFCYYGKGETFEGSYDGNGKRVFNLSVNSLSENGSYAGLFSVCKNGAFRDLLVEGSVYGRSGYSRTGLLCGSAVNVAILNVGTKGTVYSGYSMAGGIVGEITGVTAKNVFYVGMIRGGLMTGGLFGCLNNGGNSIFNGYSVPYFMDTAVQGSVLGGFAGSTTGNSWGYLYYNYNVCSVGGVDGFDYPANFVAGKVASDMYLNSNFVNLLNVNGFGYVWVMDVSKDGVYNNWGYPVFKNI